MCGKDKLQTTQNKHRSKAQDKRKFGCYLAVLLLITLPIAQLNVFAFTNGVPPEQVVEKLGAKTLAKFVGDDPWGSTASGGTVPTTGGDGPSKNALDQESPVQSTDDEKQEEKKDDDSKNKDENKSNKSSDNKDGEKNSSSSNSSSNKQSNSGSNSNSNSSSSSNSGSNSNSNSGSNTNTNTDSSDTKPEPTGHWEQKLVKEAWTETVTVTQYRCMCGQIFDSPEAWQAHRPNP